MNSPNPALMRAYGTDEVFFKKASRQRRVVDAVSEKVAGEFLRKLALAPTMNMPKPPMPLKAMPHAPMKTMAQAPMPGALAAPGGAPKGMTQPGTAAAPILPGATKAYDPFDKSTFGPQKDETGVPRAQRQAALQNRTPPAVQAESSRQTASNMQAPGKLQGDRVATGALVGPQKPVVGTLSGAVPSTPASAASNPLAAAPAGAAPAAAAAKPGFLDKAKAALTPGWKGKAMLAGAGALAAYGTYKGLQTGANVAEGLANGGNIGYGATPGGYYPPQFATQ